ncbi:MAG: fibrobacter succinogenes major paralogous domain-containing protein [Bacteroidales bacterium]|nr:fibrobacter succinogenes major paralogous domain-containing protein [Bacteroidales bacterium]
MKTNVKLLKMKKFYCNFLNFMHASSLPRGKQLFIKPIIAFIIITTLFYCISCEEDTIQGPIIIEEDTPVTDYDGNSYKTVRIGNQIWMAENLRSIHYSDGMPIQNFVYNNDTANVSIYGRLYTWSASMRNASSSNSNPSQVQGASPQGWHIPSDAEWQELINNLGGESVAGGKLKEEGFLHWESPNTGATNESMFSALPTGWLDFTGVFNGIEKGCFSRTASAQDSYEVYIRELTSTRSSIPRGGLHPYDAIPIRCVKNN